MDRPSIRSPSCGPTALSRSPRVGPRVLEKDEAEDIGFRGPPKPQATLYHKAGLCISALGWGCGVL